MDKSKIVLLLSAILILVFAISVTAEEDAVSKLTDYVAKANATYSGLKNYKADVIIKERHDGKIDEEHFDSLYNNSPRRLYARWKEGGMHAGLQASYLPEKDGKDYFQGLETGVKGIVGITKHRLDSKLIQKLYPHHFKIDQYNLGFLLNHIQMINKKAFALNKSKVFEDPDACKEAKQAVKCFRIELTDSPADGIPYKRAVLGFDEKTGLPFYSATYKFDDKLYASYNWETFQMNVAIDDDEFEIKKK